jgi:hypothetical protein
MLCLTFGLLEYKVLNSLSSLFYERRIFNQNKDADAIAL